MRDPDANGFLAPRSRLRRTIEDRLVQAEETYASFLMAWRSLVTATNGERAAATTEYLRARRAWQQVRLQLEREARRLVDDVTRGHADGGPPVTDAPH